MVAGGVDRGTAVGRGEEEAGLGQASPSDVFYIVFCEVEKGGGDVIDLGGSASRTGRNECLLFISRPVWGVLLHSLSGLRQTPLFTFRRWHPLS